MKFALAATAAVLMMSAVAQAHGGQENGNLSKDAEIQALAAKVATKFGMKASTSTYEGGSISSVNFSMPLKKPYTVVIGGESSEVNVAWPISIYNESAADTKSLLEKILKLPKSAVAGMTKAYVQHQKDDNELEWNESISSYTPNALPADMRESVKGELMWVTVPYITKPRELRGRLWTSGGSSKQIGEITVPTTNLAMVLKYPGIPVYKKGDLKKAILSNAETRAALVAQLHENMTNFAYDTKNNYGLRYEGFKDKGESTDKYTVIDWATIVKSYEK